MGIDSAGPAGLCSGGGESAPGKHKWSLLWEEATLRGPCPSESMREAQGECQLVLKGESQDLIRREKDMHVLGNHLGLLPLPPAEIKLHTSSHSLALHHCNKYTRDVT